MATKTKIIWRLANRPTPDEIRGLHTDGLLTKDEAREILINLETEDERSKKSLQEEIKFLRDLIQKMSTNRTVIVETIREIEKPYRRNDWYQPYVTWTNGLANANTLAISGSATGSATNAVYATAGDQLYIADGGNGSDFSSINTF